LIAGREEALNRGECRRLHQIDHHRRGEHADRAAAHARRRVLARNDKPDLPSEAGLELSQPGRAHAAMLALLLLAVVLLAIDVAAHLVLLALKARLFLRAELAVLHGPGLVALDARFLVLQARRFARGELARFQPLLDALLLVDVPLNRPCLGERRAAKADG